jgi:hypothetical protein
MALKAQIQYLTHQPQLAVDLVEMTAVLVAMVVQVVALQTVEPEVLELLVKATQAVSGLQLETGQLQLVAVAAVLARLVGMARPVFRVMVVLVQPHQLQARQ